MPLVLISLVLLLYVLPWICKKYQESNALDHFIKLYKIMFFFLEFTIAMRIINNVEVHTLDRYLNTDNLFSFIFS